MRASIFFWTWAAAGGSGYTGLDRFGRLIDLHYQTGPAATVHRYRYGYDNADNAKFARVTQATWQGQPRGEHVLGRTRQRVAESAGQTIVPVVSFFMRRILSKRVLEITPRVRRLFSSGYPQLLVIPQPACDRSQCPSR